MGWSEWKNLGGVNFGAISKPYKSGLSTHTIDVTGKSKLYYSTYIGTNNYIKLTVNGTTTTLSSDDETVKSSDFFGKIVNGIKLKHSIDVSTDDTITVTAYSYTNGNYLCDFLFSFDEIVKIEGDYLLYAN